MVMIDEPYFYFQIKGKDVILEVIFMLQGWTIYSIMDNDKFYKKVKCSCRVGGILWQKQALLIR